jgi:hypothetical protein
MLDGRAQTDSAANVVADRSSLNFIAYTEVFENGCGKLAARRAG